MKLVEVLAKELKEWPSYAKIAYQSCVDSEIYFNHKLGHCSSESNFYAEVIATDRDEASVTKEQWQAEREKLNKPKEKSVSKDGWIRHRGGKCKLPYYTMVEIRVRDGLVNADFPGNFRWTHIGAPGDIMSYRAVKKDDCEIDKSFEEAKSESKAIADEQESFNAISIRDEIKERKAEIEVNQKRIAELVEKLRSEGFALIGGESDEDMSDSKNWKKGDVVVATATVASSNPAYIAGNTYTLRSDYDGYSVQTEIDENWSDSNGWNAANFKFHHRPK